MSKQRRLSRVLILLICLLISSAGHAKDGRKPNIIIIFTDDHRGISVAPLEWRTN